MQRMLLTLAITALVLASLAAGALAAHWPFWQRAWQWHAAPGGWPATIKGAKQVLQGGDGALVLNFDADAAVESVAKSRTTHALLRAGSDGQVAAWFDGDHEPRSLVDGRGLAAVVLAPLYAQLASEQAGLLDTPVGAWLSDWSKEDRRGVITPRQLFWQLSGMPAGEFNPLNPFSSRAQLAAGPDFTRAALRWQPDYPPGAHFEESPVNPQLLALVASELDAAPFHEVVQKRLWSRVAADDAEAMLDHRGGEMAAHCCLRASLSDWLRLGLLLAADGKVRGEESWPPGFMAQAGAASPVHEGYGLGFHLLSQADGPLLEAGSPGRRLLIAPRSGTALLWVGEGDPPPGLAALLSADTAGTSGRAAMP